MNLGDFAPGDIIKHWFDTWNSFTGLPENLGGTPAVSVYRQGSTVEDSSGATVTTGYDSVTGLNYVEIDTSADGSFFAAARDFAIVLTTGTLGGQNVAPKVLAQFSISNRMARANVKQVNDVTITGTGVETTDEWRPE